MTTATVHPATGYHIARRPMNLAGRRVAPGQPVPESVVTWTLLELAWIVPATKAEFEAAVSVHGRPPEALFVGWDYAKTNGQPRRRTKTTAKTRTKARRKKARRKKTSR